MLYIIIYIFFNFFNLFFRTAHANLSILLPLQQDVFHMFLTF